MALTEHVIMPAADYQAACDALRNASGKTDLIKSGDLAAEIAEVSSGGNIELDERLGFFKLTIDMTAKVITLYSVMYDLIYAATGSYDVTIPDHFVGFEDYSVVIAI